MEVGSEPNVAPKFGLVGFFDVLGYQQLHQNNKISDIIELLRRTFLRLPELVRERLLVIYKNDEDTRRAVEAFLDDYEWLLFSDTILCCAELTKQLSPEERMIRWMLYLSSVVELGGLAFDEGIPLRGAIAVGDFFVGQVSGHRVFAGKPIIEAHLLEKQCEFAGFAFTESALNEFNKVIWAGKKCVKSKHRSSLLAASNEFDMLHFLNTIVVPYDVPLKGGVLKSRVVRWIYLSQIGATPGTDFNAMVEKSFTSHGKKMDPSVGPKMANTSNMIRHFSDEASMYVQRGEELAKDMLPRLRRARK